MPGITMGMCELDHILFSVFVSEWGSFFATLPHRKWKSVICMVRFSFAIEMRGHLLTLCSNYAAQLPVHSILVLKPTEDCANTTSPRSRGCLNNATGRVFYNLNIVWYHDSVGFLRLISQQHSAVYQRPSLPNKKQVNTACWSCESKQS